MQASDGERSKRIERYEASLNTAGLTFSEVVGERFRERILTQGGGAGIVSLCAEAGMGKTWLAHDVSSYLEKRGYVTRYESLRDTKGDLACRKIQRIARETRGMALDLKAPKVVALDDVPAIDECDLGKVRRALERMVERNTLVVLCMRPEAEVLAEEIEGARRLFSPDLIDIYHVDLDDQGFAGADQSRDVAALVFTGADLESSARLRTRLWSKAVIALVGELLRQTLPLEEQRLRLSMMLLGSGTFDELSSVLPKLDSETLEWLGRDTPFFGIDRAQGSFSCIGLGELDVFRAAVEQMRDACASLHDTVLRSAQVLARRGDFARLAEVCELCDEGGMAEIGCEWGVELVCEGRVQLVRKALRSFDELGLEQTEAQLLAAQAVAWVSEAEALLSDATSEGEVAGDSSDVARKRRLVELLRACRNLDRCVSAGKVSIRREDDDMARALARHAKARRLILGGKPSEAYALLVNDPLRLSANTLVAAWLCNDFEIAQALIGEVAREEERHAFERARLTMERTGVERLVSYQSMVSPFITVLVGRAKQLEKAEETVARASRMGDDMIQAVLLLALAVLDNRQKAYSRAHVRALQAAELLSGPGGRHLLLVSRLVDALAAMGLGDNGGIVALARRTAPSAVRDLAAYMVCQEAEEADAIELSVLTVSSCSRDVIWMLNMLCNDFGNASAAFREVIPQSWLALSRRSVKKVQAAMRRAADERSGGGDDDEVMLADSEHPVTQPGAGDEEKLVSIKVLGDFGISIHGEPLNRSSFGRRRASSLLTFLAMRRGHVMRRFELVECIWPEADFDAGRQRVYEASSTVRTILSRANGGEKVELFVGAKTNGVIGLDPKLVSIDVDQFERLGHAALAQEDDAVVIDLAIRATALYGGDLCETPFDATGIAEVRRIELRNLFVDVSVAGATAAMREDLLPLAVRMAWAAHNASDMREDVVLVLVEALKMSNRVLDARNVYLSYARRLLEQTGEPPSASLRASIARLFPSPRGAQPKKGGGTKRGRELVGVNMVSR